MEPKVNSVEEIALSGEDPLESGDAPLASWSDARLVRACLGGDEAAWSALIHRYKRLIYSIPIKYGASPDDAADIFQAVCLELFSELSNLRKIEYLKSWLITVAGHQSFHWKKRQRPGNVELDAMEPELAESKIPATGALPQEMVEEVQREQIMREAFARLQPRCAQMMQLLFYEDPPLPYSEVAQRLGLATGSIGFIRGRCLKKLQTILTEMGF